VHNAASSHQALAIALVWWSAGVALACAYLALGYRLFLRRGAG
jgi:cytochrome bd-type quinol oxidase subunit 2